MDNKLLEIKRASRPQIPRYTEIVKNLEESIQQASTSENKKTLIEMVKLAKMNDDWNEPISGSPLPIEPLEDPWSTNSK